MKHIKQNTAVILGASSTQGRLAAIDLVSTYEKIVLIDNDRETLEAVVEDINKYSQQNKAVGIKADLCDQGEMAKLKCMIQYKFGGIDHLVNCAQEDINLLSVEVENIWSEADSGQVLTS